MTPPHLAAASPLLRSRDNVGDMTAAAAEPTPAGEPLLKVRERIRSRLLDEDSMERAAKETLSNLRVTTVKSIRQPVASLSGGQRQSVAVAKAVMWNSKLVIMDEPTAALGVVQTKMVLDLIRRLRDRGLAVMVISHNLNDIFEVADRIAVLYLGRLVVQDKASNFDRQSAVEYMTTGGLSRTGGRRTQESCPRRDPAGGGARPDGRSG